MPQQYTCAQCGAAFQSFPSKQRRFCSKACFDVARRRFYFYVCETCQKAFSCKSKGPRRFCSYACAGRTGRVGRKDQIPHGGGYVMRYAPDHPLAPKGGYIMEHRLVMENKIGRLLERHEVVHHVNGDRADNRPENLELMNQSEHMTLHMLQYWREHPDFRPGKKRA